MRHMKNIFTGLWLAVILTACAQIVTLQTFEDKAAYASILITRVATVSSARYVEGAISKNKAEQILTALKAAQESLELANTAYKAGNFKDADALLATAIVILTQLEKEAKTP